MLECAIELKPHMYDLNNDEIATHFNVDSYKRLIIVNLIRRAASGNTAAINAIFKLME